MNPVSFADTDSASIETAVLTTYERIAKTTLYPGDPVRLFLESLALLITVQNNVIDLAGKQNLLAYAQGAHLDHLGYLMGVYRILARPAVTNLRFSMASPLAFAVPVPAGSRAATMDGASVFKTLSNAEIRPGSLFVDVRAEATVSGTRASGLLPGQIVSLVDPLPYIASVTNIDTSSDGFDIEDDERLRERIRMAPESYTVAGSRGAYIARVLEVGTEIRAVSVISPEPGVVDVRFVLENGELPDKALCQLVAEHLNSETVRPLTDMVLVGSPDPVEYSLDGAWYLRESDSALLTTISARVNAALEEYRIWQRSQPGRDINPDRLISLLEQAGAKRVELKTPVFTHLEPEQIAREKGWKLVFAGTEDE